MKEDVFRDPVGSGTKDMFGEEVGLEESDEDARLEPCLKCQEDDFSLVCTDCPDNPNNSNNKADNPKK